MKEKLNIEFIKKLSLKKKEPPWMLEHRLTSFNNFLKQSEPVFGPNLHIDFDKICYYKDKTNKMTNKWSEVSCNIKNTFDTLGVIDAEEKYLGGVTNQYESEVFYHSKSIDNGIIFTSTDDALQKYPDLFKKYFNNLVKYSENKYTALNNAVWSGGSFIYIPKGVKVDKPLQSYNRKCFFRTIRTYNNYC